MNNKGQSLALFVILIPLILMLGVYAVDIGYMKYNQNKLDLVNKEAIDYALDNISDLNKEKVRDLIILNDKDVKTINIEDIDNGIQIEIDKSFKGLFGSFINKDVYDVKSVFEGTIIDGKKNIERVR